MGGLCSTFKWQQTNERLFVFPPLKWLPSLILEKRRDFYGIGSASCCLSWRLMGSVTFFWSCEKSLLSFFNLGYSGSNGYIRNKISQRETMNVSVCPVGQKCKPHGVGLKKNTLISILWNITPNGVCLSSKKVFFNWMLWGKSLPTIH